MATSSAAIRLRWETDRENEHRFEAILLDDRGNEKGPTIAGHDKTTLGELRQEIIKVTLGNRKG
jgi:hypothetical protein